MRIPLSWLREYVRVDATAQQIADALSISTAEVNEVGPVGVLGDPSLFRVGHVLEAGKHPDADRLQLTQVDVGEERPYQIEFCHRPTAYPMNAVQPAKRNTAR